MRDILAGASTSLSPDRPSLKITPFEWIRKLIVGAVVLSVVQFLPRAEPPEYLRSAAMRGFVRSSVFS